MTRRARDKFPNKIDKRPILIMAVAYLIIRIVLGNL